MMAADYGGLRLMRALEVGGPSWSCSREQLAIFH